MTTAHADNGLEEAEGTEGTEVAVIGMALRVPGADSLDEFWCNLRDGVESVRELTEDELRAAGVSDADRQHPHYVPMRAPLNRVKEFDAALFGFSPRDAAIMDPQHRHFLEVSWQALEHAGYDAGRFDGAIGIFGGSGHNAYMPYNLMTNPDLVDSVGFFLVRHTNNDKDFLVTRVAYVFDLHGPAINVQTACSTSLVGVHLGVQSLLNGESDMVLAGGVTIDMPLDRGYRYKEGEILSKDGHCRAFDAQSSGTVFGSGAGVVVLKRLDDALADRDTIHAVIRGTAINNDGSNKVGFLAPSVDGQSAAVGEAIAVANVDPETIGFIECHGTGTEIGDPIEVAALTQAFRAHTEKQQFCALGSVKTNIGHLDTAAGIAGFIKACLALEHRIIPPTVHFTSPNPRIAFEGSPFYVNAEPIEWASDGRPRRAGVSSLGVGGTNAHIVLEEAPAPRPGGRSRSWQLLPLSAKGPTALDDATTNLARFLRETPDVDLADVAYTLQEGRQALDVRRYAVVTDGTDAASVLAGEHPKRIHTATTQPKDRSVVFMFPGQGAQYADMGHGLYEQEAVFRDCVDECAAMLEPLMGLDLRSVLFPGPDQLDWANDQLSHTAITQPAIFTTEYAMARLWMSWGIHPTAMIGHSIGEYTAACLADVFSLSDALGVVVRRGRLMQDLPSGSMLAIPQAAAEVETYLSEHLSLAARNAPEFSVVAGPHQLIDALEAELEGHDVAVRRLHTSHAFHSSMMDPMLEAFAEVVAGVERREPRIPYVSNVTGTWITAEQLTDPGYWAQHVRGAVDFVGGLATILSGDAEPILLEVGPGRTLSTFARQIEGPHRKTISTSMRHATAESDDLEATLTTLGELWAGGALRDWTAFRGDEARNRIPLPTYPFQHQEFWVEPGENTMGRVSRSLAKNADVADWFSIPGWNQTPPPAAHEATESTWLIFLDAIGVGVGVADALRAHADVVTVSKGDSFASPGSGQFIIDPSNPDHYRQLTKELAGREQLPGAIAYLWPLSQDLDLDPSAPGFEAGEVDTFFGQFFLAQALAGEIENDLDWWVVTNQMHAVGSEQDVHPLQALALGPVKVIGQEHPNIRCRSVDVGSLLVSERRMEALVDQLVAELRARSADQVIAHRGRSRFVQTHIPTPIDHPGDTGCLIKHRGVYLITGGTGGVGLELAEHLASTEAARLILVARSELPARSDWEHWLHDNRANHPTSRTIRKLMSMEAAGSEIMVAAADVTDAEQISSVVAAAVERFGGIDGVFHAAGYLADGLIVMKESSEVASVLAAKVTGTLLLEKALDNVALDFLVLFSSVSAITGTAGQIDYAAANAFLDAYAQHRTNTDARVTVAIGWGPWQNVGMTVRTAIGLGLMDDTDNMVPTDHPLLDRWDEKADEDVFETVISTGSQWLLDEHRAPGRVGLMPGTGYLDIATAAFDQRAEGTAFELSDVFFMAPLMVADGKEATMRVSLRRTDHEFVISSAAAGVAQEHARGQIRALSAEEPRSLDLVAIRQRCRGRVVEFDRYENPQLEWGPRWNTLRTAAYGEHEALLTLSLPAPFVGDLADHRLHPAVLDLATGGALELIAGFSVGQDFFVPFSYGRLRQYRPFTEQMHSHVRIRPAQDHDAAVFDISIADTTGVVLVEIEGFVMRRATGKIAASVAPVADSDVRTDPLLESLENGIGTDDGMEALRRVLSGDPPPVVAVVSQHLHALIQRSLEAGDRSTGLDGGTGIAHARPDVSTPFVAPESDREVSIAAIWEEMLGVAGVGVHDDFFELGGHSLLLTQAITRIKKLTTAEVSLFTLFEAPTIREQIVEIEKAEGEQGADGGPAMPTLKKISRDGYRTQVGALQAQAQGHLPGPEGRP